MSVNQAIWIEIGIIIRESCKFFLVTIHSRGSFNSSLQLIAVSYCSCASLLLITFWRLRDGDRLILYDFLRAFPLARKIRDYVKFSWKYIPIFNEGLINFAYTFQYLSQIFTSFPLKKKIARALVITGRAVVFERVDTANRRTWNFFWEANERKGMVVD